MATPVFVLGGAQSDFARVISREGRTVGDLVREVTEGALDDARVEASQVGAVHVGNAFGELFSSQAQLGAMPATVVPALWGVAAARHEAACASGSVAVLAAMAEIEAGRCACALVVGVEEERNVPGDLAARHLGTAALADAEGQGARYLWPHLFSRVADAYAERWGIDRRHLAAIAQKNFAYARANPLAQTRRWSLTPASFSDDDAHNPTVEGRLRRHDCGQVTDGGAAVLLASADFAREHSARTGRSIDRVARIVGYGHRTAGLSLDAKLQRGRESPWLFAHLRGAITDALSRAAVAASHDLDGVEAHDCFSITEYMIIDHFGFEAPGEAWRAIESGLVAPGGRVPFNPSGGLIGLGHPVGATGVRMLRDAALQVEGRAGACQVDGARTFATLNIGGSATTVVSLIVQVGASTSAQRV